MRMVLTLIAALSLAACGGENGTQPDPEPRPVANGSAPTPQQGRTVPLEDYAVAQISVNGHVIEVYVADDWDKMREGLMFVGPDQLGPNQGMIFVYADEADRSFWMRNTPAPLDIAFLTSDGTIVNILTMAPFDESQYPSAAPAQYAVEMRAGWFESHGIDAGDRFDLTGILHP